MPVALPLLPPRQLVRRAVVLYLLLRACITFIALLAASLGFDRPDSPFGIVLLTSVVLLADIARRREQALWANLGLPSWTIAGLGATVALAGEVATMPLWRWLWAALGTA